MFRSRRLWLFSPLATLTLFFALCGWRNTHLERDINGVWLEGVAYGLAHISPTAQVQMYGARPDQLDEVTGLMRHRFPQQQALDWGGSTLTPTTVVQVLEPKIYNRFYATAYCTYKDHRSRDSEFLVFTRSPIKFWDNSWHVARAEPGTPRAPFYTIF